MTNMPSQIKTAFHRAVQRRSAARWVRSSTVWHPAQSSGLPSRSGHRPSILVEGCSASVETSYTTSLHRIDSRRPDMTIRRRSSAPRRRSLSYRAHRAHARRLRTQQRGVFPLSPYGLPALGEARIHPNAEEDLCPRTTEPSHPIRMTRAKGPREPPSLPRPLSPFTLSLSPRCP